MNHTRAELLQAEATMNQMRNAVTHLVRYMNKKGIKDDEVKERFKRMGSNIAKTYINYWKPIEAVSLRNVQDVIATIYKNMFSSTIIVEIDEKEKKIIIKDSKCSMCKYKFDDVKVSGCEIFLGLVPEFINSINSNLKKSPLTIIPDKVVQARAYGNELCMHTYKYTLGGN